MPESEKSSTAPPGQQITIGVLFAAVGGAFISAFSSLNHEGFRATASVAGIGFGISALNFLHGKIRALRDEDYNLALTERPGFAFADFVLNAIVCLTFIYQALRLGNALSLMGAVILTRLADIALVVVSRRSTISDRVRRAHRVWLAIDVAVIAVMAVILARGNFSQIYSTVAYAYLAIAITDIIIDYSFNWQLYFSPYVDWGEFAKHWDERQGERGDLYRQKVIIPALQRLLGQQTNARVLDLGCGNGCIARALRDLGARVVAVDKFPQMIHYASSDEYDNQGIWYETIDLTSFPATALASGPFQLVVSVFTLQDCDSLHLPFEWIELNLAPSGRAVIIYENSFAFSPSAKHFTTRRRWLEKANDKTKRRGRRQLITWRPAHEGDRALRTVTRDYGRAKTTSAQPAALAWN